MFGKTGYGGCCTNFSSGILCMCTPFDSASLSYKVCAAVGALYDTLSLCLSQSLSKTSYNIL